MGAIDTVMYYASLDDYREYAPPTFEYMVMRKRGPIDVMRNILLATIRESPVCHPNDLPSDSGLYFVVGKQAVVYVGKSVDLRQRWTGHRLRPEVTSGQCQLRWKRVDADNFCNAEHEEAMFIALLRPRLNQSLRAKIHAESWKTMV